MIQIGPTCGFYSLAFAAKELGIKCKPKKLASKLVFSAFSEATSHIGEIFDVNDFEEYAMWVGMFTGVDLIAEVRKVKKNITIGENEVIIFPIMRNQPHYIAIRSIKDNVAEYYDSEFGLIRHAPVSQIIEQNKKLPSRIDWQKFFETGANGKPYKPAFSRGLLDYKLHKKIKERIRSNKGILKETDVRMKGYYVKVTA